MVTMKEIAEICGVSRGTVDRALNGRGRVNAEKIRKTARELGYEPNPAGKALSARKKRPVIGIVLSSEDNPFFDDVLKGMEEAAAEYKIYGVQIEYHIMKGYDTEKQLATLKEIAGKVQGHRLRLEGFKARMEKVPGFHLSATLENNDDDICAFEKTKELLAEHPEINAISILAAGVYGTCRAIMQLPEEKRPLVISFDTVPTTVEMLKTGLIKATIYQHPYRQGFSAVNKAFEYLVHGHVPEKELCIMKNEIKLFENL